MNRRFERRNVLAATGGLAIAGLAGCLDDGDEANGTGTEANGDESSGDDATALAGSDDERLGVGDDRLSFDDLAAWLPAPSAIDASAYSAGAIAPAGIDAVSDRLPDGQWESMTEVLWDTAYQVDPETASLHVSTELFEVVVGDVDRDQVVSNLHLGADTATEYGEYAVIEGDDVPDIGFAVSESAIVAARTSPAGDVVRSVIDAYTGDADRYVDVDSTVETIGEALPDGHRCWLELPEFDGYPVDLASDLEAAGEVDGIGDEAAETVHVLVFSDASDVTETAADEYVESRADADQWLEYEIAVDDAIVTISGRKDAGSVIG